MFKLTIFTSNREPAQRHQWPVRIKAEYTADDSPAHIFLMQEATEGEFGEAQFRCIASAVDMIDLPEGSASDASSPFYRVAEVNVLRRSAAAAEEFVTKVKAAVQDLADNIESSVSLSESEVVTITPGSSVIII